MSAISPTDLLVQARHLAEKEPVDPRQASLRRAASTAYYALFHLLVTEAARALAPRKTGPLPQLLGRAFVHEEMAQACRTFSGGGALPGVVAVFYPGGVTIPGELQRVAEAFVVLQKARHDADYGTHKVWTRTEAITEVERAEEAFRDWDVIKPRARPSAAQAALIPVTHLFLTWLAFQKKLQNRQ